MQAESPKKTLLVATLLSVVCSIVVSSAAVLLAPAQEANRKLDERRNILRAAGLVERGASAEEIEAAFAGVEARVVDLDTGQALSEVAADTFDLKAVKKDPATSAALDSSADPAGINRRPSRGVVYLVREGGKVSRVVLPVHGYGLWSTMWGFLALGPDLKTIEGLGFYAHGETPGLGGEIDNPRWQASWQGKQAFDGSGAPALALVKTAIDPGKPGSEHQIDSLSGATITARGVQNTMNYWLGEDGYGPTLARLRDSGELAHE